MIISDWLTLNENWKFDQLWENGDAICSLITSELYWILPADGEVCV